MKSKPQKLLINFDWLIIKSVKTFQPLKLIYKIIYLVYHHLQPAELQLAVFKSEAFLELGSVRTSVHT